MKRIGGYTDYYITEEGRVFSAKRKTIRELKFGRSGEYHNVTLSALPMKKTTYYVHKLVAQTFIDNPESKPHVNHIDGNKLNNSVDNLEWCTQKENVAHAWLTGLNKKRFGKDNPSYKHGKSRTREQRRIYEARYRAKLKQESSHD